MAAARTTARTPTLTARAAALAAALALVGPTPATAAETTGPEPVSACWSNTGPYQRELEAHLRRPVDGTESVADCLAIRSFQWKNGVRPADGYAGVDTYRMMLVVAARPNPNARGDCPVEEERVTCVDLDRQLLWVQEDDRIVFPVVPIRTGRDTDETRRGRHEIYWRSKDHKSTLYNNAPMPYAQFFDGGQAIHARSDYLYAHGGSGGCVNLAEPDAVKLWNLLTEGDTVYVWGTKPGTDD
ncbi:L,D-transpeptidase family protein [Streptomyces sp. NPDC059385]|uniref:L,D-transpeptidase family protein n=1 Tax=Streptomyces sp. NPDC059385 TaxID=3346817 RepID=UPI003687F22D